MRIAVPTNDGASVSGHFGRSAAFLIFETKDGQITSREKRVNTAHHSPSQGGCGDGSAAHETHSHSEILQSLLGCDLVLCAGMGGRAAEALQSGGITPVIVAASGPAEEAVTAYLNGKLIPESGSYCHCSY